MAKEIGMCAPAFWWALMILLSLTCMTLEVASLSTPRWFKQGTSFTEWEGGLLKSYPSETYYKDKDCDRDYHGDGYCDMFKNLWIGGVVYTVCESLSIASFFACIVIYLFYLNKKSSTCVLATFVIWAAVILHFVGFVTWAVLAKMVYKGSCIKLYSENGDKPGNVCKKEGAIIALITILYIPLIACLQTLIWYYSRKLIDEEQPQIREVAGKGYLSPPENPELSSREESSREFASSAEFGSSRDVNSASDI